MFTKAMFLEGKILEFHEFAIICFWRKQHFLARFDEETKGKIEV